MFCGGASYTSSTSPSRRGAVAPAMTPTGQSRAQRARSTTCPQYNRLPPRFDFSMRHRTWVWRTHSDNTAAFTQLGLFCQTFALPDVFSALAAALERLRPLFALVISCRILFRRLARPLHYLQEAYTMRARMLRAHRMRTRFMAHFPYLDMPIDVLEHQTTMDLFMYEIACSECSAVLKDLPASAIPIPFHYPRIVAL